MKTRLTLVAIFFLALLMSGTTLLAKGNRVLIIGFDGMSSSAMRSEKANMPQFNMMMENGSWSLDVRSVLPSSSAVNWASIFMGSGPELHGYTEWGSKTPELPSRVVNENGIYPTIFSILKEQRKDSKSACFYEWSGIKYLVDTVAIDRHQRVSIADPKSNKDLEEFIEYYNAEQPDLCALIFDNPDATGHKIGWETPEYFAMLNNVDSKLKIVVDGVMSQKESKDLMIVIVSDHGGIEKGHGGKTMTEMQVPVIYYGAKVKAQGELKESIMIYDVTATIAKYMKLKQPQAWIARPADVIK
ncbi:MAG: alkaline phosphatase [Rikenellaceae bacterium]